MSSSSFKVPQVRLGSSGLQVSKVIAGCMTYGSSDWQGWVLGAQETKEHIKAFLDLGINTFDLSDVYSNGESERVVGAALRELKVNREDIVVMTKVFFNVSDDMSAQIGAPGKPNQSGLSRKHIFAAIKNSLERLGLDYVDVLQCHRFDPNTPIEETMRALHDVVQSGMVRYIGMSSCYAYQFQLMQQYAIQNGLTPFISMQNFYNAAYREEEREMMPTLNHFKVGSIPWSPLCRGLLTRPASDQSTTRSKTDKHMEALSTAPGFKEINAKIEEIAKKRKVSMAQVSLAWLLSRSAVSAAIVGSTKVENIADLAHGVELKLTEEEIEAISAPYTPRRIYGHT